jgi:hypothetical protein
VAKKRKRRRPSGQRPAGPAAAGDAGGSAQAPSQPAQGRSPERKERKEEARLARQAAYRRMRRQRLIRRAAVWGGLGLAVIVIVSLLTRSHYSYNHALASRANKVALDAGCTDIQSPPDQGHEHLTEGAAFTYDQQPPTSGNHDPTPLPAGVYTTPQSETMMVHSLEHGAVEIYYTASGSGALPAPVVNGLAQVAKGKVILTPAPQALSPPLDGKTFTVSLAFAAWDRLRQCPGTVSADDSKLIARAFIDQFVNAPNAREAGRPI